MAHVKKLILGLQPTNRMFRIGSLSGVIIDALLAARGNELSVDYYLQIGESKNQVFINLINEKEGNSLFIDTNNVVLTKSAYPDGHVDLDVTLKEFLAVWNIVNKIVQLKEVRRIGWVAEHRLELPESNNQYLLTKLTKIAPPEHPAKFRLSFENHRPTKDPLVRPDVSKSDFTNVMYEYYDSAMDTQDPADGKVNANIDFQKYYAPPLQNRLANGIEAHFYAFKTELTTFYAQWTELGLKK